MFFNPLPPPSPSIPPAPGPLSRFGDTAANAGTLAVLDTYESTRTLPVGVKTLAASASAGAFRVLLMPVDALKTIMQVRAWARGVCGRTRGGAGEHCERSLVCNARPAPRRMPRATQTPMQLHAHTLVSSWLASW